MTLRHRSRFNNTRKVRMTPKLFQAVTVPSSRFSNKKFHREPGWRSYRRTPACAAPPALRNWLLDTGSLTQRLIQASSHQFRVEVLNQRVERPFLSELRALNMPLGAKALVRETLLYGKNVPWVYARSILPLSTLTGRLRRLRKLDNSPLGALLFKDPSMVRSPIEVACVTALNSHLPEAVQHFSEPLWGRRSVFYLSAKPLLVSEIFLPGFKPYDSKPYNHPLKTIY